MPLHALVFPLSYLTFWLGMQASNFQVLYVCTSTGFTTFYLKQFEAFILIMISHAMDFAELHLLFFRGWICFTYNLGG